MRTPVYFVIAHGGEDPAREKKTQEGEQAQASARAAGRHPGVWSNIGSWQACAGTHGHTESLGSG